MDNLLTAIKTTKIKVVDSEDGVSTTAHLAPVSAAISTPDQALKILREQPNPQTLHDTLNFFHQAAKKPDGFNVRVPGPLSAQIIGTLVNSTVPDYWETWEESDHHDRRLVVQSLKCVAGIGALIARIKSLCLEERAQPDQQMKRPRSTKTQVRIALDVLGQVIDGRDTASETWNDISAFVSAPIQRQLIWREFVLQVTSGRIVSVCAQAEDVLKEVTENLDGFWMASGPRFSKWVGSNITTMLRSARSDAVPAAALFLGKSLTLGYNEHIVGEIISDLIRGPPSKADQLQQVLQKARTHEQRRFLLSALDWISKKHPGAQRAAPKETESEKTAIGGAAALIAAIISSSDSTKEALVNWLTVERSVSSFATRRAALAALRTDGDRIARVMERTMQQFGDDLFIKHTPIMQQEALAQVLLISSGYVHRSDPMFLFTIARSSTHMSGTSNRLSASSLRARFLGMVTAMALSELIDKPDKRLKFEIPDTETDEAQWYRQLVYVNDSIGSLEDISLDKKTEDKPTTASKRETKRQQQRGPGSIRGRDTSNPTDSGPRIVEILDSDDDDDDLIPYAKPDSDPEDDSEDPTLVTRNKPTAPVYIRDLLAGLREAEDYDKHQLALSTAASLIRRKAHFGKEVADSLEELAFVLTNLKDQFGLDGFEEMRQQALIAVLLADPESMGPLFVQSFYTGDFSISQRAALLTAIGLGARELADFDDSGDNNNNNNGSATTGKASSSKNTTFPSKTLPPALHKIYSSTPEKTRIDAISNQLKQTLISPLALSAADQVTGPSALKVRTFSSRMDVAKRRRVITNSLAKVVAHSFFFPLTGGWWAYAKASSAGSTGGGGGVLHSPHILPLLLKTLAIVLHASGPATLSLPQMTAELLDLLLALRAAATADAAVCEAVLFALLAALEVNEDGERLVREQARELLETQEWVRLVFERTPADGSEEEERVRSLAAAVLVRVGEVVERWQRVLMGDMVDF